jgi:heme oxygenase (staphylobilin-producing)
MFVSINRLRIKAGEGAMLEDRFRESTGLDGVSGFLRFRLLRESWRPEKQEGEEYLSITEWESREDFLSWVASDAFKRSHAGPKLDIFLGPPEPAGYDIAVEKVPGEGKVQL